MTVAIGLVCADGVVVASDSMSSSGGVARRGQKVHAMQHLPVVWTASGSVYVIEEVEQALGTLDTEANSRATVRASFTTPRLLEVRANLGDCVRAKMRECYATLMPGYGMRQDPHGVQIHPFGTDFLLLGFGGGTPYFLEIAHDGQLNWHHDAGFYAVGSGGEFASVAQTLMAPYMEGEDLLVELGLQLAYRTIANTIEVSSKYVGYPVRLAVVDGGGARVLDDGDVERVKQAVEGSMKIEAETLRKKPGGEPEPLEELPTIIEDEPVPREGGP